MTPALVPAPSATGRFVLRDVVDVATGDRTSGQDVEVVDGVLARIGASGPPPGEVWTSSKPA